MDCQNCGSPLEREGETCAFCGVRSSTVPAAEVPDEHRRGEGREVGKTFEDSLRAIQAGIAHSDRRHRIDLRRNRFGLMALALLLAFPFLFLVAVLHQERRQPADYEACVTQGVAAVMAGDFRGGKELLAQAVFERHHQAEPHVLYGAAFLHELLLKPSLPEKVQNDLSYGFYREINFALQADPNDPRAHFFMALYRYRSGDAKTAETCMETCLSNLSKIPEETMRARYEASGRAFLERVRANRAVQLTSGLRPGEKPAIEVPYGR